VVKATESISGPQAGYPELIGGLMLELDIDQTEQVAIKATQEIADLFYRLRWPSPPIITGGIVNSVVKAINAVLLFNQSSGQRELCPEGKCIYCHYNVPHQNCHIFKAGR
jgi:hypothetical protein